MVLNSEMPGRLPEKLTLKELLRPCLIWIELNMLLSMPLQEKIEFKHNLVLFLQLKRVKMQKIYSLKLYGEIVRELNFHG